ncbi:unnamed protein product [Moneuplotes crassus]|uniref:Uncharacterized protein n=1 Tax=Euplotes crassus TaxID=5936 RepID=A0AAD1X736_EUPCR|nr:unnamed protein product [Moneuplotes crassus]
MLINKVEIDSSSRKLSSTSSMDCSIPLRESKQSIDEERVCLPPKSPPVSIFNYSYKNRKKLRKPEKVVQNVPISVSLHKFGNMPNLPQIRKSQNRRSEKRCSSQQQKQKPQVTSFQNSLNSSILRFFSRIPNSRLQKRNLKFLNRSLNTKLNKKQKLVVKEVFRLNALRSISPCALETDGIASRFIK